MIKTERVPKEGWFGYTVCPKCGYREKCISFYDNEKGTKSLCQLTKN